MIEDHAQPRIAERPVIVIGEVYAAAKRVSGALEF